MSINGLIQAARRWLGGSLMLFCGLGLLGFATQKNRDPNVVPGLVVLALLGLGGFFVYRSGKVPASIPKLDQAALEQKVLESARRHRGRITVSELALDLGCDLAEAERLLDALVTARVTELEVSDRGLVVYVFRTFEALPPAADSSLGQSPRVQTQRDKQST